MSCTMFLAQLNGQSIKVSSIIMVLKKQNEILMKCPKFEIELISHCL